MEASRLDQTWQNGVTSASAGLAQCLFRSEEIDDVQQDQVRILQGMCLALEMASLVLPIGQSSLLLRQELAVLLHGQQTLFIFKDGLRKPD